jgi:hypothetical protein
MNTEKVKDLNWAEKREIHDALVAAQALIERASRQCQTPACWSFAERDGAREKLSSAISLFNGG